MLDIIKNKSVFPIVSRAAQINLESCSSSKHLSSMVKSLTLAELGALKEDGFSIPGIVTEGEIYIRHPFIPKTIINIKETRDCILIEKFRKIGEILNLLGAKHLVLKGKIVSEEERSFQIDKGEIRIQNVKILGHLKRIIKRNLSSDISLEIINDNSWNRDKDIPLAKERVEEYGLTHDLLDLVHNREIRPIDHYHLEVDFSKEFNEIMDAAATLQVLGPNIKLEGSFKKQVQYRDKFMIDQDIEFCKPTSL